MDREKLLRLLEQRYPPKRDILSRVPLGVQADALWEELLSRRRANATILPLYDCKGSPYWYVTTDRMIAASEKIVETLLENDSDFDPYTDAPTVSTLEEIFFTGYVEGAQIGMKEAMEFITAEQQPRDIEEQLLLNNRAAGNYAGANLYRPIDEAFLKELVALLTEGMDHGGAEYRNDDDAGTGTVFGDEFIFPSARLIPERMQQLCEFLALPQVHPLIKAGVAQVCLMVIKPFSEGNDRLGRLLSCMILLRAGYTFFGDISLSSLIARKSYGYYEAISNTLREENGMDMTYFLDYFLELLSRAIDERQLRREQDAKNSLQQERSMAQTPLAGSQTSPPFTPDDGPGGDPGNETPMLQTGDHAVEALDNLEDFQTIPLTDSAGEESAEEREQHTLDVLRDYARDPTRPIGHVSAYLLNMIESGHFRFTTNEIKVELELTIQDVGSCIHHLKRHRVIEQVQNGSNLKCFRICAGNDPEPQEECPIEDDLLKQCDPALAEKIIELEKSNSPKDKRIASVLHGGLPKGTVTSEDYELRGEQTRFIPDMEFAAQLGLVKKVSNQAYRILPKPSNAPPCLNRLQKKVITEIYESFGDKPFSVEMLVATLDYSGSRMSAYLHQFTMLKLLDCRKEDVFHYQFLVNPEQHPQYFDKAA